MGIGLGLTAHRKTLFLRREASLLEEISSRAKEAMRPGDGWRGMGNGGLLRTASGRTIQFAGCEHEKDKQKYKGRAHDLKFWDEVVDFTESQYTFVNAWNRTTAPGQRCRIVAASNPPTDAAGEWVIRRWAPWLDPSYSNPAAPGELRWFANVGDEDVEVESSVPIVIAGEEYKPRSRSFIPGQMLDVLVATGYRDTLAGMADELRDIYLHGDFGATRRDGAFQLIPTAWIKLAHARYERRKKEGFAPMGQIGCDVARGGSAKTALAILHGSYKDRPTIGRLIHKKGIDTPDGASVLAMIEKVDGCRDVPVLVDCTGGYGGSVLDVGKERGGWSNLKPIVVSNSTTYHDPAIGKLQFLNLRAAIMWNVRRLLNPNSGPDDTRLALPPDRELTADLVAPTYRSAVGKIQVESKPDIAERIGRSPDLGDAVGLACWERKVSSFIIGRND